MSRFYLFLRKLFLQDDGPTAVEYAVMLSLIMAVCIPAIRSFGGNLSTMCSNISNSIGTGGSSSGHSNNGGGNNSGSGNNGGGNNNGS